MLNGKDNVPCFHGKESSFKSEHITSSGSDKSKNPKVKTSRLKKHSTSNSKSVDSLTKFDCSFVEKSPVVVHKVRLN